MLCNVVVSAPGCPLRPNQINFFLNQLAEPIRLLLNYTETEFKDERYELGDGKFFSACVLLEIFAHFGSWYPGGDSRMKQTEMLVGNFEFNP